MFGDVGDDRPAEAGARCTTFVPQLQCGPVVAREGQMGPHPACSIAQGELGRPVRV